MSNGALSALRVFFSHPAFLEVFSAIVRWTLEPDLYCTMTYLCEIEDGYWREALESKGLYRSAWDSGPDEVSLICHGRGFEQVRNSQKNVLLLSWIQYQHWVMDIISTGRSERYHL